MKASNHRRMTLVAIAHLQDLAQLHSYKHYSPGSSPRIMRRRMLSSMKEGSITG